MVQRYSNNGFCVEDAAGRYVKYEDYAELEEDFKGYKASAYVVAKQYAGIIKELEAELQKYKDQFPDYVECANCGSVTHVERAEGTMGQSGCHKEDAQECKHKWVMHDADDFQTCSKCGETA